MGWYFKPSVLSKSIVPESPEVMFLVYHMAAIAAFLEYLVFSNASWFLFCRWSYCPLKYPSPTTKAVILCFSSWFPKVKKGHPVRVSRLITQG